MMTAYALLLGRCGLSHREAADLHGVRLDTVKSWASGRNPVPAGAVRELRALFAKIETAAAETVKLVQKRSVSPDCVEIGLASDDHEARDLGWPCVGAHAALAGTVAARLGCDVSVTPRGSTHATAAAEQAHRGPKTRKF